RGGDIAEGLQQGEGLAVLLGVDEVGDPISGLEDPARPGPRQLGRTQGGTELVESGRLLTILTPARLGKGGGAVRDHAWQGIKVPSLRLGSGRLLRMVADRGRAVTPSTTQATRHRQSRRAVEERWTVTVRSVVSRSSAAPAPEAPTPPDAAGTRPVDPAPRPYLHLDET